jgi:hypothetical protein
VARVGCDVKKRQLPSTQTHQHLVWGPSYGQYVAEHDLNLRKSAIHLIKYRKIAWKLDYHHWVCGGEGVGARAWAWVEGVHWARLISEHITTILLDNHSR